VPDVGLVVALDVGTTGVRGVVADVDGRIVAEHACDAPYESNAEGFAEIDPRRWWTASCAVLQRLAMHGPFAAICVTGQAPTIACVDAHGEPTCPAILWLDTRASAQASRLGVHSYYGGPKVAWLAEHAPEAISRARWMLQSHSFIAHKLTGEAATDASTAALCAPLFDPATNAWRYAHDVEIDLHKLPIIRPATDIVGAVRRDAAAATGLSSGTPVVVGTGDFAASVLGCGVTETGEAALTLGTSGNLSLPMSHFGTDRRLIHSTQALHTSESPRPLSLGGTLAGGVLAWFSAAMAPGVPFDVLEAEAREADSSDLVFLPYLAGERTPIWNPDARGVFTGLSLRHTRGHLYRAVLESVATSFLDLAVASGSSLTRVIASNGAGKSALLRQMLADALGVTLHYAPSQSGTLLGGALLALLGAGVTSDERLAVAWRKTETVHQPDESRGRYFRQLLERRRALYGATLVSCHRDSPA
jgi:xylulokinase